jgi:CRISPR-associated endonuclease Csn1
MCIFCGVSMRDQDVKDGRLDLQIEHAIPLSRGGPKGLSNVVLCHAGCNQNKGSMTPYEWISNGKAGRAQDWSAFSSRVRAIFKGKAFKSKIENLLVTDMKGRDSAFKERDLNDTRWISKFVIAGLKHLGTDDQPIEVIPVNAGLIGTLRYAWGLDAWKREPTDRKKRRLDDRHHALDAAIVACVDRALIQRLTRAYQLAEEREDYFEARGFPPPWRTFQRDLVERIYGRGAYDEGPAKFVGDSLRGIFVVREEIRRARGPIHSENPSSVRIRDGREVAFKSITLAEFKAAHLEKLKDRNDPRNLRLVRLLTEWIAKGSPPDDPPRIPYRRSDGAMVEQPVRRVQIECAVPPVRYNTGSDIGHGRPKPGASNEGMPRIDLFLSIEKGSPKFLAVPIYRSSLTSSMPPRQAIVSGTPRELPPDAVFRMSLYKKTPVRVTDTSGRSAIGYFQYFDTDSSRLEIWPQYSLDPSLRGRVAVGKLASIERVGVDRLGAVLPGAVDDMKGRSERRTWHGKVCT